MPRALSEKNSAERIISSACAELREESSSVQKKAVAAVGQRRSVELRLRCRESGPAGASLDPLSQLCLLARSADHDAPDEVQSKLPPVDGAASRGLFDAAGGHECIRRVSRISLLGAAGGCLVRRGPLRQAVDGVSQIREHVRLSFFADSGSNGIFRRLPSCQASPQTQNGQSLISSRNSAGEPCHG